MAGNWMEINMIIFKMENILYLKMAKMEKKKWNTTSTHFLL